MAGRRGISMKESRFSCHKSGSSIKILSYYVAVFYTQKADDARCAMLSERILPLIEGTRGDLCNGWIREKIEHQCKYKVLYAKAFDDIQKVFMILKQRIICAKLLENEKIKPRICVIETMLGLRSADEKTFSKVYDDKGFPDLICCNCELSEEAHRAYVFPSYVWGVYEAVKRLCCALIDMRREDLINDYAEIEYSDCQDPLLFGLNFFSSLNEYEDHQSIFFRLGDERLHMQGWVAYENLWRIKWARDINRDFFRKKGLRYQNKKACDKSASILSLHGLYAEVKTIQNKHINKKKRKVTFLIGENREPVEIELGNAKPFFLDEQYINQSLAVVLSAMGVPLDENLDDYDFPQSIELGFEKTHYLCLAVQWTPEIFEICQLHGFQDIEKNVRHDFIADILDNPKEFRSMKRLAADGINAKQYLERIGIKGVLDKLFIEQKTGTGAILRAKRVDLTKESAVTRKKIRKYTQGLKTVVWRHYSF